MIINVLQANPGEYFTARKLAQKIIETYKDELTEKRQNTRFASDEDFLNQITAEVGGSRTVKAKAMCTQVMTRDKPRPRLYYWGEDLVETTQIMSLSDMTPVPSVETINFTEHALYPLLIEYLSEEEELLCRRIDEKRSSNNKGLGANQDGKHIMQTESEVLTDHTELICSNNIERTVTGRDAALKQIVALIKNHSDISN